MTDNEKAATFIGWEPGQKVRGQGDLPWRHSYVNRSAPDMSKPENYMRALEQIADPYNWEILSRALYFTILHHPGPPIVEVLAGFYDAEHPQGA